MNTKNKVEPKEMNDPIEATKFQPSERIRVVGDPPRHAGEPEEMHREEGQVHADEGGPEMDLAPVSLYWRPDILPIQ